MRTQPPATIECIDRNKQLHTVPVSDLRPRTSVYGILLKDDKILLVPHWDGYDLPGGGIEIHETISQALVREFHEETGLTVVPKNIITAESSFFVMQDDTTRYLKSILLYYLVEYHSGTINTNGFDIHEKKHAGLATWIPLTQLHNITFYNSVDSQAIIAQALQIHHS